jgi:oligopeptide/dipeptide ABC transporter ATP-binding protein
MSDTNTGRGAGLAGSNGATTTPGANGGPRNTSASAPRTTRDTVLSVRDLRVRFGTKRGVANVVNGISYDLRSAETLAIVGESGSGKSVGVLALLGLLKEPPASVSGSIRYRDRELIGMSPREWRTVRGKGMAMIFQDPMTSLNPVKTVGYQLAEPMAHHLGLTGKAAERRAIELLELVGIPAPESRLKNYPHQLSGGMRQRVMIAMGLSCDPDVLIADEATTALDVTTQAQIIELVGSLQERIGMSVIWITHDLGVVAGIADRVHVMYGGRFMEEAGVDELYAAPRHPYTHGLLGAIPMPGSERPDRLTTIPGLPPDPVLMPVGCPFAPRCPRSDGARCESELPEMQGGGAAEAGSIPVEGAAPVEGASPGGASLAPDGAPAGAAGPAHRAACHYPLEGKAAHE